MYRMLLSSLCFFWFSLNSPLLGQLVYSDPAFPTSEEEVILYFDATQGNGGLANCGCNIYLHTGVITNLSNAPSDWRYVPTTWGVANANWQMTPVPGQPNLYSYTFSPSVRSYFNVPGSEDILKLAFVFRNADGSQTGRDEGGGDIFLDLFEASTGFVAVLQSPTNNALVVETGEAIPIRAVTSETSTITVRDNGILLTEQTTDILEYDLIASTAGSHLVTITADNGSEQTELSFAYAIPISIPNANPPANTPLGIHFINDNQSALLHLFAPGKEHVFVLGDFNDWRPNTDYQMTKSLDGNSWWLQVDGLIPGQQYVFQYLVNGELRIADPYSTLVLDPSNDPFIPEVTYPDLPIYPEGAQGVATLIHPGAPEYNWQVNNFVRPPKEELVIYELLLRDFIARHDYTTLIDTLNYLSRLGVNAIELMPVNEFSGNISWGYNPTFHMALDKYYGPIDEFKRFVDACHQRGMAVILDVVFNHVDWPSPFVSLYWNQTAGQPAADNPWLNPVAPHDFSVFFDFNHESTATRDYIDRVLQYWLSEFRVDGYRFDLSKGFTQNDNGPFDAGPYDASRIAIIKHYADVVWQTTPGAYMILEHFADWTEEKELVEYGQGMMVWNNMTHQFGQAAQGFGTNLTGASYTFRNWTVPGIITYMESHDEERLMYKNLQFGNSSGSYNTRDFETALDRIKMVTMFHYAIPGPKMLWQFGEVGYDFSINYCEDGSISDACRTNPKPIRWDYYQNAARRELYDYTSAMTFLKKRYPIFNTTNFELDLGQNLKKVKLQDGDLRIVAVGNCGVNSGTISQAFSNSGWWYDYFTGDSLFVNTPNLLLNLDAGEFHLYSNQPLDPPTSSRETIPSLTDWQLFPNPNDGAFTLGVELTTAASLQLAVYNLQGQRLYARQLGQRTPGWHTEDMQWNLPAGTYLIQLLAEGQTATRMMVVR
ncbi:MAG TPA: alpha-amylase family glycosyl hydrolase [Saprospiraceae bacterium]|nr:alpha-amylase family glycosyl hydrolase [Saprospiraceae bacterium]HMQ83979.1 alpha-amylase family glycosyl hydrolase [Saprospiraceae bacterium]